MDADTFAAAAIPGPRDASPGASTSRASSLSALRARQRRFAFAVHALTTAGFALGCLQLAVGTVTALDVAALFIMYSVAGLGITVGYHRLFAHHAFETGPVLRVLLAVAGSVAAEGPVTYWVALHRKHHQCSDASGDPHSPHGRGEGLGGAVRGLAFAQLGWTLDGEVPNTVAYAKDLLRDPQVARVNRSFFACVVAGWFVPALVVGLVTRSSAGAWHGFVWGGLVRTFLVLHATSAVNSVCHRFGRRPFTTRERSTNVALLAIPTVGEAWHNNHHAFPRSAILGLTWWQIDLGGLVVRALEAVGLAWNVQRPDAASVHVRARAEPLGAGAGKQSGRDAHAFEPAKEA